MLAQRIVRIFAAVAAVLVMVVVSSGHADAAFGRTKPILKIVDAPIFTGSKEAPALKDVERAIRAAALDEHWMVTKIEDGHLQAELTIRSHFAKVDITYTTESYSIVYKDSLKLLYDGKEIHRNYNNWVQHLSDRIRLQLAQL